MKTLTRYDIYTPVHLWLHSAAPPSVELSVPEKTLTGPLSTSVYIIY